MLPSSDFQVASSEANRLPTLKELIGYRTNKRTLGSPSPVILNLFPLAIAAANEEISSREKDANHIVEGKATTVRNDASWALNDDRNNEETNYGKLPNDLDLAAYYVEDDDDTSLTSKKRIDRQDSSTTTSLKPTTMRGVPLIDLLQSQVPRGFYVTRGEKVESRENVSSKTKVADKIEHSDTIVTDLTCDDVEENSKCSTQVASTLTPDLTMMKNSEIKDEVAKESDTEIPSSEENATASIPTSESPVTFTSPSESVVSTNEDATLPTENIDFVPTSTVEVRSNDLTTTTSTLEEPVTEARFDLENETNTVDLQDSYSTDSVLRLTDENGKNLTKQDDEETKLVTTLPPASTIDKSEKIPSKPNRRRHKIEFNPNYEFGRKSHGNNHRYLNNDQEDSTKEARRTQLPRRRVTSYSYRGRHHRGPSVVSSTIAIDSAVEEETDLVNGTRANDLATDGKHDDGENVNEKETSVEKKANLTGGEEERLGIEGNVGRTEPEVSLHFKFPAFATHDDGRKKCNNFELWRSLNSDAIARAFSLSPSLLSLYLSLSLPSHLTNCKTKRKRGKRKVNESALVR